MTTIFQLLKLSRPIAVLLIALMAPAISEAYIFRVLGVSGKIKVRNGAQEFALRAGTKLEIGQSLVLENGYCGLVHSNGKILELKTAGTFSVEELAGKISGMAKIKVSDKYLDYIYGKLNQKEAEDVDKNVRKFMDVPGSVDRGSTQKSAYATARVFAYRSNDVRPAAYTLSWEAAEGVKNYDVSLTNRFDETVFSKQVQGNSIEIDFGKIPAQGPDSYTLKVTYQGKASGKEKVYQFKVNAPEDLGLQSEESPAAHMLNGIICEENHYYLDALNFYQTAGKLEPEVTSYGEAFEKLKSRME
jgi:hypothetical protein